MARALQDKKASTIRTPSGKLLSNNDNIANHFAHYYTDLYNLLPEQKPQADSPLRKSIMPDFLTQYSPRPISQEQAHNIDSPLTSEEFVAANKEIKLGKNPGPDEYCMTYTFSNLLTDPFLRAFNQLSQPNTTSNNLL